MPTPLVTIVISVYDTEPMHLHQAVESALNQSYAAVEVIVVDDGSTRSETLACIDSLTGVHVLRQDKRGTGAAVNAGIRAGSGNFLLALGSDDVIESEAVEHLMQTLSGSPDTVIAFPVVEYFGAQSGFMSTPDKLRLEDIAWYNKIVATSLVRREHWEGSGGFDEHRDCSEDWVLWATVLGITGGTANKSHGALLRYRRTGVSQGVQNQSLPRVQNARRHIAANLPHRSSELYLAVAEQGDGVVLERTSLIEQARRWAKIEPLVGPLLPLYRKMRDASDWT